MKRHVLSNRYARQGLDHVKIPIVSGYNEHTKYIFSETKQKQHRKKRRRRK
jgi:hypothetical protein